MTTMMVAAARTGQVPTRSATEPSRTRPTTRAAQYPETTTPATAGSSVTASSRKAKAHNPTTDQSNTGTSSARTESATRTGPVGGPLFGARTGADDDLHDTPDYLHGIEQFADGRTVIAAVIGADPEIDG